MPLMSGKSIYRLALTFLNTHRAGLMVCAVVSVIAQFLSQHYHAPVMLFAILLGLALNFLSKQPATMPGITLCASQVLRLGVALLGLRITFSQILDLGWYSLALVLICMTLTLLFSVLLAKKLGMHPLFGWLSGGATAICGASAALSISAALPHHPQKDRATILTIIVVSVLSTVAMIVYPMLVKLLNLNAQEAGIFLGGSIHDVAQVVGAGYAISHDTGDQATLVKLLRVLMLAPIVLTVSLISGRYIGAWTKTGIFSAKGQSQSLRPPWFVTVFLLLAVLHSVNGLPAFIIDWGQKSSQWLLIVGMVAIGMKTQLKEIIQVGARPIVLMVLETLFLAALLVIGLYLWH